MKLLRPLCLLCILLFPETVLAKSFSVPGEKPLASLTIPDDWKTNNDDPAGLVAKSPDEHVLIAAGVAPAADQDQVVSSLMQLLTLNGFQPDLATKEASNAEGDFNGNHAKTTTLAYLGKDKDGTGKLSIMTYQFDARPDQIFAFGEITDSHVAKADSDAVAVIANSVHFSP